MTTTIRIARDIAITIKVNVNLAITRQWRIWGERHNIAIEVKLPCHVTRNPRNIHLNLLYGVGWVYHFAKSHHNWGVNTHICAVIGGRNGG